MIVKFIRYEFGDEQALLQRVARVMAQLYSPHPGGNHSLGGSPAVSLLRAAVRRESADKRRFELLDEWMHVHMLPTEEQLSRVRTSPPRHHNHKHLDTTHRISA